MRTTPYGAKRSFLEFSMTFDPGNVWGGYAPNHWRGQWPNRDAIKRLLQRLQTGWAPRDAEIEPGVPQVDWPWNFEDAGTIVPLGITYQTTDRQPRKTAGVLYMDEHPSLSERWSSWSTVRRSRAGGGSRPERTRPASSCRRWCRIRRTM
jgi:hypothetical protein